MALRKCKALIQREEKVKYHRELGNLWRKSVRFTHQRFLHSQAQSSTVIFSHFFPLSEFPFYLFHEVFEILVTLHGLC